MKTRHLLGLLVVFTLCVAAASLKSTAASWLISNNQNVVGVPPESRSEYPSSVQTPTPVSTPPVRIKPNPRPERDRVWSLRPDPTPSMPPNADIILFIHGMDSRA